MIFRRFNGNDWLLGRLDGTSLHLRFASPNDLKEWGDDCRWRFSRRRILNPLRWWRACKNPWNWSLRSRLDRGMNHRCYCPVGWSLDGSIKLAGFGVIWWASHYGGAIPCVCDEVMREIFGEEMEQ